ncbi:hypothetical protein GOP47_0019500 [Adiantum capillus-veneris]|uniref:Uncharacterized protein n=1 Tax=Adiantum capillus-veneris TaxID=13818 RepID=A0A9D4UBF1_ADICA|nr:hypothetical protein GOP47_0019500 [Adiantum capillus-veneris]
MPTPQLYHNRKPTPPRISLPRQLLALCSLGFILAASYARAEASSSHPNTTTLLLINRDSTTTKSYESIMEELERLSEESFDFSLVISKGRHKLNYNESIPSLPTSNPLQANKLSTLQHCSVPSTEPHTNEVVLPHLKQPRDF